MLLAREPAAEERQTDRRARSSGPPPVPAASSLAVRGELSDQRPPVLRLVGASAGRSAVSPGTAQRGRNEQIAAFIAAKSSGAWADAAVRLNGFDDDDMLRLVSRLEHGERVRLKEAAIAAMPGWSDRVTRAVDRIDRQAGRVGGVFAAYDAAVRSGSWAVAALLLNGFAPYDLEARVRALSHDQRVALREAAVSAMPGFAARVTGVIDHVDREAGRVGALFAYFEAARAAGDWRRAALAANGFSSVDLVIRLGTLTPDELRSLREAAVRAMPGWSSRVTDTVDVLLAKGPARAAGFWWPDLVGRPISAWEAAALQAVVDYRRSLTVRGELATRSFSPAAGTTSTGYQYAGKKAAPFAPASDPLHILALAEFGLGEGGVSAVVTYDTTLSLGAGFADAAAAQWARDWFDSDIDAEAAFVTAGATVTRRGTWLAVDDGARIIEGEDARKFVRGNAKLLSLFITLSESPEHTKTAAQAQQDWIKLHEIDRIPTALRTEMETWPPAAAAAALHLAHWLPAGGPIVSWKRYVGTGGDPVAIAKAFARGLGTTPALRPHLVGSNGAIVIGATVQTSNAVEHYFAQFGLGAKDPGYLKRGVEAAAGRLTMSVDDAKADPRLTDHVIYLAHGFTGRTDTPVELLDLDV